MTRSNAREVAVHLIYEIDYTGEDPAQAIETRMDRSYYSGLSAENDVYAERPSKKQMDYIRTCVTGVCEHAEELDALIAQYAVRWNLHRISRLTKAAMRLAIYEMRYVDDVPNGVAINECVELTRKYEDAQVVSFVNGILGSVARGAKPNTEAPADPQPEEAQPEETPSEETQPLWRRRSSHEGACLRHQQLYDLGRVLRRHGRSQYLAPARCGAGRARTAPERCAVRPCKTPAGACRQAVFGYRHGRRL